jgi:hypothetical protein
MRFGLTKQSVLGLALAGAMGLTMIGSAAAATDGTSNVTVTGTVPGTLTLEFTTQSVGISNIALGTCNAADGSLSATVTSNLPYSGSVSAAVTGVALQVNQLYRLAGTTAPDCDTTGEALSGTATAGNWIAANAPATDSTGATYDESYALDLGSFEPGGAFTYTLTYSATQ